MVPYSDNASASMSKIRSVLASAMKDGFKSALPEDKLRQGRLANEIVKTILLELETYIADMTNVAID